MKNNFTSSKKPKIGFVALLLFFCVLWGNGAMAQNLISNGDFETNTTGWTFPTGGVSRTTVTAENRGGSAGALTFGTTFRNAYTPFTATVGTAYTATVYVRHQLITTTGDNNLYMSIAGPSGVALSQPIVGFTAVHPVVTPTYIIYRLTFVAPQTNLTLSMFRQGNAAASGGNTINIDDVSVEESAITSITSPGPYSFVGDATPKTPTFSVTPTFAASYRGSIYATSATAPSASGNYNVIAGVANGTGRDYLNVAFFITGVSTVGTLPASLVNTGQALSTATFTGGVTNVPGTFAFNSPSTVPSMGPSNHAYTFTPTDTVNFTTVTGTLTVISGQVFGWNVSALAGGTNSFGTQGLAATSRNSNVTVGGLTRGAGLTTSGTGAARGWGGLAVVTTTQASAITASQFITFSVRPTNSSTTVSLSSIDPFSYRRSATGPTTGALQYSTDGTNFVDITTTLDFSVTATTGGSIASIDLSGITALQNIPSTTTVTFRLVPFNSALGGTFYIFDTASSLVSDLSIQGSVLCVTPAAPTASNLTVAFDGTAKSVTASVAAGNTVDWYSVSTGGSPVLSSSLISPANTAAGTYTYFAEARNTASGCSLVSATRTSVVITILPQTTWTGGALTSDWTNASNWNNGVPDATKDVVIAAAANQPIIAADVSIKSLTLNATTTLAVNSGNLTVTGAVINGGTMTIENNANLIQGGTTNTNSGNIIVKRNSNPLLRLDYTMWSSPVSGTQTLAQFSPLTSQAPNRFYTFDPTFGTSGQYVATTFGSPFALGTGYLIRMPNENPLELGTGSNYYLGTQAITYNGVFTGVPNNGDITLGSVTPLVAGKFYSVGNPYPSSINASSFFSGNTNLGTTLYFWRKTNNTPNGTIPSGNGTAYATWTNLGGTSSSGNVAPNDLIPNGEIAVGQGFIVNTGTATTINFTNAMRTGTAATFFKTKATATPDRLWLNLTNATDAFSQTLIGYTANATLGVDNGIDGEYINDSSLALTSNINNKEYTIQGRPTFDPTDVVALNFKTAIAGDYTIALDHYDGLFATGQDVYLVDSKTGVETNLKAGSYTFAATAGVDNARFSLKYQKTLRVDAPAFNDNSVRVFKNNGALYVNSGTAAISNIKVFDIQGRLIAEQKNVKATSAVINNLRASNQLLIVKIAGENNSVVTKKVVN